MSRTNSSLAYDESYANGKVPRMGICYEPELTLLVKTRSCAAFAHHTSADEVIMIGGSITVSF